MSILKELQRQQDEAKNAAVNLDLIVPSNALDCLNDTLVLFEQIGNQAWRAQASDVIEGIQEANKSISYLRSVLKYTVCELQMQIESEKEKIEDE